MDRDIKREFQVKGEELVKKIKELIHEGNVRRIIIKDAEGKQKECPNCGGVMTWYDVYKQWGCYSCGHQED